MAPVQEQLPAYLDPQAIMTWDPTIADAILGLREEVKDSHKAACAAMAVCGGVAGAGDLQGLRLWVQLRIMAWLVAYGFAGTWSLIAYPAVWLFVVLFAGGAGFAMFLAAWGASTIETALRRNS